uniref:Chloride channel protein n=1 Tax=Alexandrium monilatum TaxID=311494 RepID=A0A7S4UII4_9DINO
MPPLPELPDRARTRSDRSNMTDMEYEDDMDGEQMGPGFHAQHRHATFSRCISHKMPKGTESMTYEVNESDQYMDFLERREAVKWRGFKGGFRWFLLCAIGFITGLIAIAVDFCIEHLCEWRMELNNAVVRAVRHKPAGVLLQYLSFVGSRLVMAAAAGFLVCYVEVLAAGSGIPEIKCYLNGVRLRKVVGVKTLVAKAAGIVFSVAADLPVGKEGPMIHSGAIIGALFTGCPLWQNLHPASLDTEKRDLVAAGASAGVSAAFGAPIGSVLFAIEEGTSHMNPTILLRLFVAASVAALVSRLVSSVEGHLPFGELGTKVPVSFGKFMTMDYALHELVLFVLLALLGGASGSLFTAMNKRLSLWRKKRIPPTGAKRFLEVLVVDLLVVSILFWVPVLGSGCEPLEFEGDEMDSTMKLYWSTGTVSMKSLFHSGKNFHEGYLLVFALLNFLLSCLTYGLGVPSGLFVPSLLTGAAFGRFFGQMVQKAMRQHSTANAGIYALIGAVSNLAGTARITISLTMILMEATDNALFSLPIFFAVMVAKWTGDYLSCVTANGIYDMHIMELKHIPLLEHGPEKEMIQIKVRDVMARNPVTLQAVERLGHIIEILESCKHNGFPVVFPGTKHLAGTLHRSVLHRILENCRKHDILQDPSGELRKLPPIHYEDMAMSTSKLESYEQLVADLGPEHLQHRLDLRPYMNRNGYQMPKHASVSSCFYLFRKLGLRHLPIVATNGDVCGMVTRKDLILCEEDQEHLPEDGEDSESGMDEEETSEEQNAGQDFEDSVGPTDSGFFGGGRM